MKNILCAAALLVMSCVMHAQTQEEKSTELSHLFPEPKSWDFGIQLNQGIRGATFVVNAARGYRTTDVDLVMNLMLFADYHITDRHSMRAEIGVNGNNGLNPFINIQYAYRFSNKWSAYAGLGLEYNYIDNFARQHSLDPDYREMMPTVMIGARYNANKNLFIDLRYQHDILQRTKNQNLSTSVGRIGILSLGIGVRF